MLSSPAQPVSRRWDAWEPGLLLQGGGRRGWERGAGEETRWTENAAMGTGGWRAWPCTALSRACVRCDVPGGGSFEQPSVRCRDAVHAEAPRGRRRRARRVLLPPPGAGLRGWPGAEGPGRVVERPLASVFQRHHGQREAERRAVSAASVPGVPRPRAHGRLDVPGGAPAQRPAFGKGLCAGACPCPAKGPS